MNKLSESDILFDTILSLIGLSKKYDNEIDLSTEVYIVGYGYVKLIIKNKCHHMIINLNYPTNVKTDIDIINDIVDIDEIKQSLDILDEQIKQNILKEKIFEDMTREIVKIVKEELNKTRGGNNE